MSSLNRIRRLSVSLLVPDTCSEAFRYTIESLFISHAQTKLNSIGNVLNREHDNGYHPQSNPWLTRGSEWCRNLVRRPQAKTTVNTTASDEPS